MAICRSRSGQEWLNQYHSFAEYLHYPFSISATLTANNNINNIMDNFFMMFMQEY